MDYIDLIPEVGERAYEERQAVLAEVAAEMDADLAHIKGDAMMAEMAEEVSGDCDCCDNWSSKLVTGEDWTGAVCLSCAGMLEGWADAAEAAKERRKSAYAALYEEPVTFSTPAWCQGDAELAYMDKLEVRV